MEKIVKDLVLGQNVAAGQTRVLLDLCIALITTHPQKKEALQTFGKLIEKSYQKAASGNSDEAYLAGMNSFAELVSDALQLDMQADQTSSAKPGDSGAH